MNIQKFTQKSMEAVQDCEKLAYEYGNQEIEQEHLLVALLQQENGLIPQMIEKSNWSILKKMQHIVWKRERRFLVVRCLLEKT